MTPRGRKTLIGCLFGCAGVGLAAILLAVGFVVWLNRPGRLLEGERLVDGSTVGYATWHVSLDDPATERIVLRAFRLLQDTGSARRAGVLPGDFGRMVEQFSQQQNERKIRALFPARVTWTVRPDEGHVVAAGLAGNANQLRLLDLLFRAVVDADPASDVVQVDYRDEQIFVIDEVVAFLRSGNVVFASDEESAKLAVDRFLDGPAPAGDAGEFGALWARVPVDRPLHGGWLNVDGIFGDLATDWATERAERRARAEAPDPAPAVDEATLDEATLDGIRADLDGIASMAFGGAFAGEDSWSSP